MVQGSIIGYELNETYCQISFYNREQQEPQTMETSAEHYQIPLVVGKRNDTWVYGNEAKRLQVTREGYAAGNLLQAALHREQISFGQETYDALWLLAKFIRLTLKAYGDIGQLVFTVSEMGMEISGILKGIAQHIGVPRSSIYVQDYKESFFNYMFYQPKELWQYEAALFYCDRHEVRAYMLRKLHTGFGKGKDSFVTVDEVAQAQMKELAAIYPVLNVDRARDADACFKQFVQGVFEKKLVSSVFLVGEGFENEWYPQSLKVLCNGRRAFMGNNLYSKGACYTAYRRSLPYHAGPIYLDETKMMEQICLKLRIHGQEQWYPIVTWGSRWYEADTQFEVLLEDTEDIEIHIESLTGSELQVEKVVLEGLPARKDYALRLQVNVMFSDEKTCKIRFKDVGFGEFFPATEFCVEQVIHLGGSNGQFNSLS